MTEQELREKLRGIIYRAYRAGRQSIKDGICSGTSLDDAYIAEEIQSIVQEVIQEWDEVKDE